MPRPLHPEDQKPEWHVFASKNTALCQPTPVYSSSFFYLFRRNTCHSFVESVFRCLGGMETEEREKQSYKQHYLQYHEESSLEQTGVYTKLLLQAMKCPCHLRVNYFKNKLLLFSRDTLQKNSRDFFAISEVVGYTLPVQNVHEKVT